MKPVERKCLSQILTCQHVPGMFLFLVTQSHITADVLGKKVFGHHLDKMGTEDPVAESFETVPWLNAAALPFSHLQSAKTENPPLLRENLVWCGGVWVWQGLRSKMNWEEMLFQPALCYFGGTSAASPRARWAVLRFTWWSSCSWRFFSFRQAAICPFWWSSGLPIVGLKSPVRLSRAFWPAQIQKRIFKRALLYCFL